VIAALFPVWGMGFLAYRLCRARTLPRSLCLFLALAGAVLLVASPFLRSLPMLRFQVMGDEILGRYIDGLAFFMHLVGAYGLAGRVPRLPDGLRRSIATVAATTFPLYLLHRPLIQLFSYVGPGDASSWQRRMMLIAGTLLVVWLATPAIEKLRLILRARLSALLARLRLGRQAALPR